MTAEQRTIARPLIIAVAVFGYFALFTESPVLHADALSDILRARRCVLAGDTCWITGGPAPDAYQGAAWVQFLAGCRILGLGILATKMVTVVLFVASTLLVDVIYRRRLRGDASPALVLSLWVAAGPLIVGFPSTLWNWTPIPFASAVFFYFFFAFLEQARWRTLMCCAVSLAILCDLHLLGGLLVAPLALAIGVRAPRPIAMAAAAFGTIALLAVADSPVTWLANARFALHHPVLLPAVLVPMATTLVGMRLRRHLVGPIPARAWAVGTLATMGITAVASCLVVGRSIIREAPHYFGIVVPLVVVVAAQGIVALGRRAGRFSPLVVTGVPVAVLALVSLSPIAYDRLNLRPDLVEVEALSRWMHAHGYRGDAIPRYLGGEAGFTVLRALLVFEDAIPRSQSDAPPAVNMLVLPGYLRSSLPVGWDALVPGHLPGRFVAVSSIASFIQRGRAQVCAEPSTSTCRPWIPISYVDDAAYESYVTPGFPSDPTGVPAVRFTYEVDVPPASAPHIVQAHAGWLLTAAAGLHVRGDFPAESCIIEGGTEQHGTVTFSRAGGYDARVAPLWTEVTTDAEPLLDMPRWPYFRDDPDVAPF